MKQVFVNDILPYVNALCGTKITAVKGNPAVTIDKAEACCLKYGMAEDKMNELLAYLYLGVSNKALKKRVERLEAELKESNEKLLQLDREWAEYDAKREAEWNKYADEMQAWIEQMPQAPQPSQDATPSVDEEVEEVEVDEVGADDHEEEFNFSLEDHIKTMGATPIDNCEQALKYYNYNDFGYLIPKLEYVDIINEVAIKHNTHGVSAVLNDDAALEVYMGIIAASRFNDKRDNQAKSSFMRAGADKILGGMLSKAAEVVVSETDTMPEPVKEESAEPTLADELVTLVLREVLKREDVDLSNVELEHGAKLAANEKLNHLIDDLELRGIDIDDAGKDELWHEVEAKYKHIGFHNNKWEFMRGHARGIVYKVVKNDKENLKGDSVWRVADAINEKLNNGTWSVEKYNTVVEAAKARGLSADDLLPF
jgi:hypothetical protein